MGKVYVRNLEKKVKKLNKQLFKMDTTIDEFISLTIEGNWVAIERLAKKLDKNFDIRRSFCK